MIRIVAAFALFSVPALAHIEEGTWKGTTADGRECSMLVGKQYFENNRPHPLNERIPVTVGEDAFVVGHPPLIKSEETLVFFNHDLFQGLLPTAAGAKAVEITMVHSAEFEGPTSFTVMENQWRANKREKTVCSGIKLQR